MKKNVVVLLSGGLDSTTCLADILRGHSPENVLALSVQYGQVHKKELDAARRIAAYYDVSHLVVNLDQVFQFSDSPLIASARTAIPGTSYAEQLQELGGEGTVPTYVPFRNGVMLSVAGALALSIGAHFLVYGAHADDSVGRAYPDCSPRFVEAMGDSLFEGSGGKLHLMAPILNLSKADVVRLGLDLDAPYELTWSCYTGESRPCGVCGTCRDRAAAFAANHKEDPALSEC